MKSLHSSMTLCSKQIKVQNFFSNLCNNIRLDKY